MLPGFGLVYRHPAENTPLGLVCCSPCALLKVHGHELSDGHVRVGMDSTYLWGGNGAENAAENVPTVSCWVLGVSQFLSYYRQQA